MLENEKQSDFKCSHLKYFDSIESILSSIISIDGCTGIAKFYF